MKAWHGYGSEHSSNLVIIGTFKEGSDAEKVARLLSQAADISRDDEIAGRMKAGVVTNQFTETMLDFIGKNNLGLSHSDVEQLLYEYDASVEGSKLVITTEELAVNVFITMMVNKGAKVEVYSAHDYKSPYGRPTAK